MALPSLWAYYACTPDHTIAVEVGLNRCCRSKGETVLAAHLRGVVYDGDDWPDSVFEELDAADRYMLQSQSNLRTLRSAAEALVCALEAKYKVCFMRGDEAWAERIRLFAV
jgi:hypothetical protein